MRYEDAKRLCHARSAIYRASNPATLHWRCDITPIDDRVPLVDQQADDWLEHDPKNSGPSYLRLA